MENAGIIPREIDQFQSSSALHFLRDARRLAYSSKEPRFTVASISFHIPRRDRSGAGQYCKEKWKRKMTIGPPFIHFRRVINTIASCYPTRSLISEERN